MEEEAASQHIHSKNAKLDPIFSIFRKQKLYTKKKIMINSYKDLKVWQKSMVLVNEIYRVVKYLPKEETYALSDQMRRAAVSIPSNIAEGQARPNRNDYLNFLSIAKGSNAELQTQCLICVNLGYINSDDIQNALSISDEVGKMLSTLITRLSAG